MIEWHQVNFETRRAGGEWCVEASPIGNKDDRLRVHSEWRPWEPHPAPHPSRSGVLLAMQRACFLELRGVLAELEGEACARCKYADGCQRAEELEEEIEAMRVADPSELAAQLIQAKRDLSSLKAGIANHLVLALGQMPIDHLARVYTGRALALLGLDVAKEAGL